MKQFDPTAHTILAIDDTPANLKLAANFLRDAGYRVLTARNGESGLERAQHGTPDLILLDVLMPGIDGFETCRRLKSNEQTENIPIIFMTALDDTRHKVKGFEVGGVDYVTKPIQPEEVLARIETHLSIRNLTFGLEKLVVARTAELEQSLLREQALTQQLEESLAMQTSLSRLKSQIIEIISHEFRTPLTVISQSAYLLTNFFDKMSAEKRTGQLNKISESVFDIDRLISDSFLIDQISTGEIDVQKTAVVPESFCEQLTSALTTKRYDIERLTISCEAGTEPIVTDMKLVSQIVSRLVDNGLKFSEGQVMVSASLGESGLTVSVADEGIGIPTANQEKVFDLFYRADNVNARRGLGVGLYLAHNFAQLLHGAISVTSAGEHQGSRFVLTIPSTEWVS